MGGLEEAYAIHPKSSSRDKFVICGYSNISAVEREVVMLEINLSLNVNWIKRLDLRFSVFTPQIANLFDITVDSSNVWAVGSITTSSATRFDGLIVKLDLSGNFQAAMNFTAPSLANEKFYGVENDGDYLAIAGGYNFKSLNHMAAWKYKKLNNSMTNIALLRVVEGLGFESSVGYDIKPYNTGGFSGYFVVGQSQPSTGSSRGLLYELDNNFNAVRQAHYSSSGDVVINSLDVDSDPFLALTGLNTYTSASFSNGYVLKTDMNGYTSCNDTLAPSSTTVSYSSDSLLRTIITTDSLYTPIIEVDTLLDSLICYDTLTVPTSRNMLLNEDQGNILNIEEGVMLSVFPNPVSSGNNLYLYSKDEIVIYIISIYDVTGTLVYQEESNRSSSGNYEVPIAESLSNGLYVLDIKYEYESVINNKSYKILIK